MMLRIFTRRLRRRFKIDSSTMKRGSRIWSRTFPSISDLYSGNLYFWVALNCELSYNSTLIEALHDLKRDIVTHSKQIGGSMRQLLLSVFCALSLGACAHTHSGHKSHDCSCHGKSAEVAKSCEKGSCPTHKGCSGCSEGSCKMTGS